MKLLIIILLLLLALTFLYFNKQIILLKNKMIILINQNNILKTKLYIHTKNNIFISFNLVRSISPIMTQSNPGGIVATSAASNPASRISINSETLSLSSKNRYILFKKRHNNLVYLTIFFGFNLIASL